MVEVGLLGAKGEVEPEGQPAGILHPIRLQEFTDAGCQEIWAPVSQTGIKLFVNGESCIPKNVVASVFIISLGISTILSFLVNERLPSNVTVPTWLHSAQ